MCHLVLSLYNSFEFLYYAEENTEKTKKSDKKICFFFFFLALRHLKIKSMKLGLYCLELLEQKRSFSSAKVI